MNAIFLIVLVIISLSSAHWLCDLASFPCNEEDGTEKYLSKNLGTWITKVGVTDESSELRCALRCLQGGGSILLYLEDSSSCLIASGVPSSTVPTSGLFFPLKRTRNAALRQPVYASSMWPHKDGNEHDAFYAVDGLLLPTNHMFHTNSEDNPWLVIDLGQKYGIKTIKFINRGDMLLPDAFVNVAVLLGNSLTTNGDFSSYLLVTTIEGPTPALGAWCIVGPDLSAGYRYVAFQRRATSGFSILEFAEVEVYV